MNLIPDHTDVLIVGLGPVGATLANLLGEYGISVFAIDKAKEIFKAPRAIALDNEALRVLQMSGMEEGDIDLVAIPEVKMHSPIFGHYSRAITAGCLDGHPKLVTFYQPELELVLRRQLGKYENVRLGLGIELLSFTQERAKVVAMVRNADGGEHKIEASYIVGADGASSLLRRVLGQEFKGKTYGEDWLVVDAKNATKPFDHVEFICDPRRPTPHMVAPGDRQRWEFKLRPGETREQMEQPDNVRRLLAPWAGSQEMQIERVAIYRFHARVADTFQLGRAFLVGDAAHVTPPFVGQGLVAGLRDVANLAWKLAWVVQERVKPAVLDSYTQERQPHAKAMIKMARLMGGLVMPSNRFVAFFVHGLMKMFSHIPKLRRQFENLEIKPANQFESGCFVKPDKHSRLQRGGQLPQTWLRSTALGDEIMLSDDAIGYGFVLIGFGGDPKRELSSKQIQDWGELGGHFVQINPRGKSCRISKSATWEDFTGTLVPNSAPVGWAAVIRPDKVVMHDGPIEQAADMLDTAISLLGASTRKDGASSPMEQTDVIASEA